MVWANTSSTFEKFDPSRVPSPCFVVDEAAVENNLKILHEVQERSGVKILLALKAFSLFSLAPLVWRYLSGVCASGPFEARLGHEEFGGRDHGMEVHVCSPAFTPWDMEQVLPVAHHVVFNSFGQWRRYRERVEHYRARRPGLKAGLRINPNHPEAETPLYDPCAPCSRLGIPREQFEGQDLTGISGLHFHTLCEQDFPPLSRTLDVVEARFGDLLNRMEWVNFGGGHHITRPGYQREALIERVRAFSDKYGVQVYLEPGEAAAIGTGVLVCEVVDVVHNGMDIAILDASATCHMPDVLEMPYRPRVFGAGEPGELAHTYRLGGQSCLAGDVMGDYSFDIPLHAGQRLLFDDMAHYTMVKTNTFNGIALPAIAVWNSSTDALRVVREFGYEDFKHRLS